MSKTPVVPIYASKRQPFSFNKQPHEKPYPILLEADLAVMEAMFPARCRHRDEDELDHERYAGKVELLAVLRDRLKTAAAHSELFPDHNLEEE